MKILITGGAGLLGSELIARAPAGVEVHATQRSAPAPAGAEAHAVDLSNAAATAALLERVRPDLVIHTAYGKQDLRSSIQVMTRNVAVGCAGVGAELVHLSTDRVFDGERAPYGEQDAVSPIEAYGEWKALTERSVATIVPGATVVRTSLIVGGPGRDPTVKKLQAGEIDPQFVDELRCAIAVEDLAAQIWEVVQLPPERRSGIWHLAGPEALSRFSLALLLARRHGADATRIQPALNRTFEQRRPRDLRLLTTRADEEISTRARPISEVLFPV